MKVAVVVAAAAAEAAAGRRRRMGISKGDVGGRGRREFLWQASKECEGRAHLLLLRVAAVQWLVREVVLPAEGGDGRHIVAGKRVGLSIVSAALLGRPLLTSGRITTARRRAIATKVRPVCVRLASALWQGGYSVAVACALRGGCLFTSGVVGSEEECECAPVFRGMSWRRGDGPPPPGGCGGGGRAVDAPEVVRVPNPGKGSDFRVRRGVELCSEELGDGGALRFSSRDQQGLKVQSGGRSWQMRSSSTRNACRSLHPPPPLSETLPPFPPLPPPNPVSFISLWEISSSPKELGPNLTLSMSSTTARDRSTRAPPPSALLIQKNLAKPKTKGHF